MEKFLVLVWLAFWDAGRAELNKESLISSVPLVPERFSGSEDREMIPLQKKAHSFKRLSSIYYLLLSPTSLHIQHPVKATSASQLAA